MPRGRKNPSDVAAAAPADDGQTQGRRKWSPEVVMRKKVRRLEKAAREIDADAIAAEIARHQQQIVGLKRALQLAQALTGNGEPDPSTPADAHQPAAAGPAEQEPIDDEVAEVIERYLRAAGPKLLRTIAADLRLRREIVERVVSWYDRFEAAEGSNPIISLAE